MKNTKKEIHKKSLDLLDKHLDNMTKKEKDDMREIFRDKRPKGWLSIEEHLPMMLAKDLEKGFSEFKVRCNDGKELLSYVTDGRIWYYAVAKKEGITHWFND